MNQSELSKRLKIRGERLRQLRLKRKFSQSQLAAKAGVCLMSIVNAEKGANIQIETEELILSKIYDDSNWKPIVVIQPQKNERVQILWANGKETFEIYPFEESELKAIFWK